MSLRFFIDQCVPNSIIQKRGSFQNLLSRVSIIRMCDRPLSCHRCDRPTKTKGDRRREAEPQADRSQAEPGNEYWRWDAPDRLTDGRSLIILPPVRSPHKNQGRSQTGGRASSRPFPGRARERVLGVGCSRSPHRRAIALHIP